MKSLSTYLLLSLALQAYPQSDSTQILMPTGANQVGKMIYEWTNPVSKVLSPDQQSDPRTLVVHMWYPASLKSDDVLATYAAPSKNYHQVSANSYYGAEFHHETSNSNLILLVPGRGTAAFLYTTIAEELASRGFVVAAVDMPGIGFTTYQNGAIIKPSGEYQPPPGMMSGPYEKVDQFFERPTKLGNNHLNFVVERISGLNDGDPTGVFTGKLNLQSIGIIGHSLGGRIAGKFTSENKSVKAYLAMEGIPPREVRYQGKIDIPSTMLCSSGTWPYAKENYHSFIDNRRQQVYMVELVDFGHNSIADHPYISPNSFKYKIDPQVGLMAIRTIAWEFFSAELKGEGNFEDALEEVDDIKITVYR